MVTAEGLAKQKAKIERLRNEAREWRDKRVKAENDAKLADENYRILVGGSYERQEGEIVKAKAALYQMRMQFEDQSRRRIVFVGNRESENYVVTRVTPKRIYGRVIGSSREQFSDHSGENFKGGARE